MVANKIKKKPEWSLPQKILVKEVAREIFRFTKHEQKQEEI